MFTKKQQTVILAMPSVRAWSWTYSRLSFMQSPGQMLASIVLLVSDTQTSPVMQQEAGTTWY